LKQLIEENNLIGAQIVDYLLIWGYQHIHSALWHAEIAMMSDSMISNSFSMEILLYLAGYRQIKKAINLLGVKKDSNKIIGVLVSEKEANLPAAFETLKETFLLEINIDIIKDFVSKRKDIVDYLEKEGYQNASDFSSMDIEKAILQRIALLSLES
jgi:tRNA threonylcarbamoyladenosine modification (KEOPS) complex Cgi121 subunit